MTGIEQNHGELCENKDARVEHLVGLWLLREGPVRSSMLFLTLVILQLEILNRRAVLPWYLYSHFHSLDQVDWVFRCSGTVEGTIMNSVTEANKRK